jgi:hypothetical protein
MKATLPIPTRRFRDIAESLFFRDAQHPTRVLEWPIRTTARRVHDVAEISFCGDTRQAPAGVGVLKNAEDPIAPGYPEVDAPTYASVSCSVSCQHKCARRTSLTRLPRRAVTSSPPEQRLTIGVIPALTDSRDPRRIESAPAPGSPAAMNSRSGVTRRTSPPRDRARPGALFTERPLLTDRREDAARTSGARSRTRFTSYNPQPEDVLVARVGRAVSKEHQRRHRRRGRSRDVRDAGPAVCAVDCCRRGYGFGRRASAGTP